MRTRAETKTCQPVRIIVNSIPIFVQQIIGIAVRSLMLIVAGWLAAHGGETYSESQIAHAVEVAVPVVAAVVWAIWTRYGSRLKLVTALGHDGPATEAQIEAKIANPNTPNPSVNTPKTEVPK